MSHDSSQRDERHMSTDVETIRQWASRHDAVPVRVRSDDGTEHLRLVPESRTTSRAEPMEWDEFQAELDRGEYVVLYREGADGEPFEVTSRDEVLSRTDVESEALREQLLEGETVTSTVQETTVVETVVVEEATVESELVGSEVLDEQILDAELVSRECTGCDLVPDAEADDAEYFDRDRYLASVGETRAGTGTRTGGPGTGSPDTTAGNSGTELGGTGLEREFPFSAELDVEEAWAVTREVTERFTVESRITETDVTEAESIEDHVIDVEGLQRAIVEEGILDVDRGPEEVMAEYDVDSELGEGDRIRTHFQRTRVVEDDVVDRIRGYADIARADLAAMDVAHEEDLATELSGSSGAEPAERESAAGDEAGRIHLTDEDIGKEVVDASGKEVGTVEDVSEDGRTVYVDARTGIAERIMSALDWGDAPERDNRIYAGQIAAVTDETVRLKEHEDLEEHRSVHGSD